MYIVMGAPSRLRTLTRTPGAGWPLRVTVPATTMSRREKSTVVVSLSRRTASRERRPVSAPGPDGANSSIRAGPAGA
jgi:hypothetical protein